MSVIMLKFTKMNGHTIEHAQMDMRFIIQQWTLDLSC